MGNIIKFLLFFVLGFSLYSGQGQETKGKVVVEHIYSPSLINKGGENPTRSVYIYLPPNYEKSTSRYPVIYYLHGFTNSDSITMTVDHFDQVLDKAISSGKISPVIVVIPNHFNDYRGSFYTNSSLTGNWSDFTAKDLVTYIDKHYRTIINRNSRGLSGHSMGGFGTLRIAMLFPDVFGSIYALSPAVSAMCKDFSISNKWTFKYAQEAKNKDELFKVFFANAVVAIGRAFSPNPDNPPFYCDLPVSYKGDRMIVNDKVLALWNKNLPFNMVDNHAEDLRKLNAIKIDWGRNDSFLHIPVACQMISQKLESYGIQHYAEEYIGDHVNKLWTDDGRVLNDLLPFFNTYLRFEEIAKEH